MGFCWHTSLELLKKLLNIRENDLEAHLGLALWIRIKTRDWGCVSVFSFIRNQIYVLLSLENTKIAVLFKLMVASSSGTICLFTFAVVLVQQANKYVSWKHRTCIIENNDETLGVTTIILAVV